MTEAGLLGHPAVEDECGRLIMRLVAVGNDLEIAAQGREVGRSRILHVANLDDVVDALADIDLVGTGLNRDFRIVGGTRASSQQSAGAPRPPGRSFHGGYVASPILLHGNPAEHAGLHLAVSFALFLLPLADLPQRVFDLVARDLRLLLLLFLLIGLFGLVLFLLFLLILLLLVLLVLFVFLLVFLLLILLLLFLLVLLLLVLVFLVLVLFLLVLFFLVLFLLFLVFLILLRLGFLDLLEDLTCLLGGGIGSRRVFLFERLDRTFHLGRRLAEPARSPFDNPP